MAIIVFDNQRSQGMDSRGIDLHISTGCRYIQLYQQYTQREYYHNAQIIGASVIWSQFNRRSAPSDRSNESCPKLALLMIKSQSILTDICY